MTDDTAQMAHRARALSYALSLLRGSGGEREGRDATGAVTVRLSASGATESIALSDGWQLRLPAGQVAAELIGLLAAVGTVVGVLAKGMAALSDKANAVARDWPSPGNADYADGSASDGDRTDWSTAR